MRAGLLTEHIDFFKPTTLTTSTGSEVNTYTCAHSCRARMTYNSGNRTNENGDIFYTHQILFEIRRGYEFDENYKIRWDGDDYRILSIEKDRHNQSTLITTEKIND